MSQTSTSDTPFDQDAQDPQSQEAMVLPEVELGAPESQQAAEAAGWSGENGQVESASGAVPDPVSVDQHDDPAAPGDDTDASDGGGDTQAADADTDVADADSDAAADTADTQAADADTDAAGDASDAQVADVDTAPYETLTVDDVSSDADATHSVDAGSADGDLDAESGDDDEDAAGEGGRTRRSRRAPSRELLEKEGEIAADFLETLLDICDLDGDIDVDIDGDRAAVSIVDSDEGRVPRRLVGTDGKVLDALQELTRLAVYSNTGERSRLILDIAGHRAQRRGTLLQLAQDAISKVRESGQEQPLTPMSAFERKIVHDEVLAAGLRSESDGAEPRRYVVVLPA